MVAGQWQPTPLSMFDLVQRDFRLITIDRTGTTMTFYLQGPRQMAFCLEIHAENGADFVCSLLAQPHFVRIAP